MAKFDAATAIEAMEYDFTAYGGSAGVIPEPSGDLLDEFLNRLTTVTSEIQQALGDSGLSDLDTDDPDSIAAVLGNLDGKNITTEMNAKYVDLVAFLTQGSPSHEDVARLPFRVLQAFIGWLVGELNPQTGAPTSSV